MTRDGAAAARLAHNQEVPGSSTSPATIPAGSTCEPDLSAPGRAPITAADPAAAGGSPERPAAVGPDDRVEILRQYDAGLSPEGMGARFRHLGLGYAQLNRIVAEECRRRADAWATGGSGVGWAEREDS